MSTHVIAGAIRQEASPMSGFPFRGGRRRCAVSVARLAAAATIGLAIAGCSNGGDAAQAANAPILVQTTQLFVTVENKAGAPLVNVTVAVVPVSGPQFTRLVSRMENGEKRDISLNEFASRDGTTFSLRAMRAKSVRVTADDVSNKKYDVEVKWK
jgi:hypothetical protein